MKTKLLTFLLSFFISIASIAQDQEVFKVLASKGTNKYTTGGSTEAKPVLIGKKLYQNDEIIVGDNSYLGLAHKSGKTIELKKAGTYKVSQLSSEVSAQNSSVSKKYIDFVLGEMSSDVEDMSKNRHKYMDVTGSVERGDEQQQLKLLAPKEAYVLNAPVTLKWYPVKDAKKYIVKVTNMFDEPIFETETSETSISVDLSKLKINEEKNLLWSVEVKGKPDLQSKASLKYPADEKVTLVNEQFKELKSTLSEETAINKFVMASFYEDNEFYLNAVESYEAAIKLEPEVEDYKIAYGQFLSRTGLAQNETK
ncbi:MAG TPA: hypothetical protein VIK89_00020 [Cytophagaceae bacterium]